MVKAFKNIGFGFGVISIQLKKHPPEAVGGKRVGGGCVGVVDQHGQVLGCGRDSTQKGGGICEADIGNQEALVIAFDMHG